MSVTIQSVAAKAGVTIGTVSRAFNGYADIRPATKERIMAAARELGYHPNVSARNLSGKNPANIGLIISGMLYGDPRDTGTFQLLRGILSYTMENNLETSVYATDSAQQSRQSYKDFCEQHTISGALLCGIRTDDAYFRELMQSGIPTVAIDFPVESDRGGWISIDNRAAAADAVTALLSSGHRELVVMTGMESADVSQVRLRGVRDACWKAQYSLDAESILEGHFNEETACLAMRDHLASGNPIPDAVFCFSDLMAIGVIRALEEKGLRVPEDVSVLGFDGLALGTVCKPRLATVEQDMTSIGREAVSMLHGLMTGKCEGGHKLVPYRLCLRESFRSRMV